MNSKLLEEAGLTEGESKVYLALLELGTTKTGPLIKKARVSSSKVYKILDRVLTGFPKLKNLRQKQEEKLLSEIVETSIVFKIKYNKIRNFSKCQIVSQTTSVHGKQ